MCYSSFLHYTLPLVGYEFGGTKENVVKNNKFLVLYSHIGDGVERSL